MNRRIQNQCQKTAIVASTILLLAGCNDDFSNSVMSSRKALEIKGSIEQECVTRADDKGFVDGDRMGVFVVDYSDGQPGTLTEEDNRANNVQYTYVAESNTWTTSSNVYWKDDSTPIDVYGYYPFANVVSDVEAYAFTVEANQNTPASDGEMSTYEASDFLWAKASKVPPGNAVSLLYQHRLAGVSVTLEMGSGFTADEWSGLEKIILVENTVRTANINMSTGVATATGSADKSIVMAEESSAYRAVVIPQTVEAGKGVIGVTIGGINYSLDRDGAGMTYEAGKLHEFTITVNKRSDSGDFEVVISNEQITSWTNDESSHEFTVNSYFIVNVEKAGTLKECIAAAGADYKTLKNLKVTGRLTNEDFVFMNYEMSVLSAVNLKGVKLVNCGLTRSGDFEGGFSFGSCVDDVIPAYAFYSNTTLRAIILPDSVKRLGECCFYDIYLTSTLALPESLTRIDFGAFQQMKSDANIIMNNSLVYIDQYAFYGCEAKCDLTLPNSLKYIGDYAFVSTDNFYGTFQLPPNLEYLGKNSFWACGTNGLTGDIEIPASLTEIPDEAFWGMGFSNGTNIIMHDGITKIGTDAFTALKHNSVLNIPKNVTFIGEGAFASTTFCGNFKIPNQVSYIGEEAFRGSNLKGNIEIPEKVSAVRTSSFATTEIESLSASDNLVQIGNKAFDWCQNLTKVELGKNVDFIGDDAFSHCYALKTFVCLAPTPPTLGDDVFFRVPMDIAILEVPENSVGLYRNTEGWKSFKNITPHRELACNLPEVTALNKGITRTAIVRAERGWKVTECPDWCTVSPMEDNGKSEITITLNELPQGSGDREGSIVFQLDNSDYTTYTTVKQYDYEYAEDTEIVLQTASAGGNEIPLLFIGEGFDAESIKNGTYLEKMKEQVEYFFAIEPYKTYRDYFTVITAIALSPDKGISDVYTTAETKFNTIHNGSSVYSSEFSCDFDGLMNYAKNVSSHIDDRNISKSLIILSLNYESSSSYTYSDYDGTTMSFCSLSTDAYPYDQRGVIQHEAGGVGFGKLGDETVTHYDFIKACNCSFCRKSDEYEAAKKKGWFENLTLSANTNDAPWKHLIFHPKYSGIVDMYEGGYYHARGVYRSESNSCMRTYIPYYNTISRESIVRRIMDYAGKAYDFETFVANDKIEIPE